MFPRLPVLSALLVVLAWCECLAVAGPPEAKSTVLRDRYGDPLPPAAIARLGTTRFRTIGGQGEIALTPDGKLLALGGVRALRLVSSTTGEEVRSIKLEMGAVGSIRFSKDGRRFAVLGIDGSLLYPLSAGGRPSDKSPIVGEVASGKILLQSEMDCFHVEFSPDSRRLFALQHKSDTEEGPVICWDVDSGKEVWRTSSVGCFALSPDGKMLAGGEKNGSVRLWEASFGRDHSHLNGHGSAIQALAFAPDGRTLVSTSGNPQFRAGEKPPEQSVRSWDVASGKQRFRCKDPGLTTDVRFAPDGRTFATVTYERRTLHLWDAASGELLQYFPGEGEPGNESSWYAFAFSPDGKMLFYVCQQDRSATIYQWDIFAGKEVRHWHTEKSLRLIHALAVSPDGKTLFEQGNCLRIWDLADGAALHEAPAHHAPILALAFSPDGRRLASQDYRLECRLWEPLSGEPVACSPASPGQCVRFYAFSGDSRFFLTLSEDAVVQVYESTRGKNLCRFHVGGRATRRAWQRLLDWESMNAFTMPPLLRDRVAAFHPGKNLLAVFREDQHIHLWDAARGKELRVLNGHRGEPINLRFSSTGNLFLSLGVDETFRVWDVARGAEVRRVPAESGSSDRFALSPDERLLAWAEEDAIHLTDVAERKEVRQLRGHRGGTEQLRFQDKGALLISYGKDRTVRLWDTKTGQELDNFEGAGKEPSITFLSSPDGHVLAQGFLNTDRDYQLRDVFTGQDICELSALSLGTLAFSPDGRTLALVEDKLILRERATGGVIAEIPAGHRGGVSCLAFSPDGRRLATGGQDSTILVWDWQRLAGLRRTAGMQIDNRELQAAWTDLAVLDARKGCQAIATLIAGGDKAVSLLRARLRPAAAEDRRAVRRLIDQLDNDDFAVREKVSQDLLRLGAEARLLLCRVSKERRTLEMRRRLEQILARAEMHCATGESVRKVRAVQVLEGIASPAARELLVACSRGDANAWLTQEASQALHRLERLGRSP